MEIDFNNLIEQFLYHPKQPLLFNSALFLMMFAIILIIHRMLQKQHAARIVFLTIFSLYFYYKSCGWFVGLIVLSAIIDYHLSNQIYKAQKQILKKTFLILSLTLNLGMLVYFKYTNFFIDIVNDIGIVQLDFISIFLPIGISFYTFENLSYTLDVYRGHFKPINKFSNYLFFLSFFPKLVAGPIVRASDFIPQITIPTIFKEADFTKGLILIIGGLFKKAIISDYISINFVDRVFDNPTLYTSTENLLATYGYTLQIYCDFSGYSDIAIGIAIWLGFTIPDNFLKPYQSVTITEFWRRWHISLSSWLRDYLYISLGGNKKGKFRQNFNLFFTMLLGGLWHGASWKFVLWGSMHGIALMADKAIGRYIDFRKNLFVKIIGVLITFHFVAFCWIFFRASNFEYAFQVINQIKLGVDFELLIKIILGYKLVFVLMGIGYLLHFLPEKLDQSFKRMIEILPLLGKAFVLAFVIWLVAQIKSSELQPFIYFQF